jgi:hypothetical protein
MAWRSPQAFFRCEVQGKQIQEVIVDEEHHSPSGAGLVAWVIPQYRLKTRGPGRRHGRKKAISLTIRDRIAVEMLMPGFPAMEILGIYAAYEMEKDTFWVRDDGLVVFPQH